MYDIIGKIWCRDMITQPPSSARNTPTVDVAPLEFSDGHRPSVFFLHIPKTAGVTLRNYLANQYRLEAIAPSNWQQLLTITPERVSRLRLLQGHFPWELKNFLPGNPRIITFLREPIARTLSTLQHLARDPEFHPLHARFKGSSVTAMLRDPMIRAFVTNSQTSMLSTPRLSLDETFGFARRMVEQGNGLDFGLLGTEVSLTLAAERLKAMDFVGVQENFDTSLLLLSEGFHFHPSTIRMQMNKNPNMQNDEVSAEDMEILHDINQADLELYSIAKTLLSQRVQQFSASELVDHLINIGIYRMGARSVELELGDPIPGSGWYNAEQQGANGSTYRWAGPTASLDLPLTAGHTYAFEALLYGRPDLAVIRVFIDDEEQTLTLERGHSPLSCTARWTAQASTGYHTTIRFEISRMRRSATVQDLRTLGFCLGRFRAIDIT